MKKETSLKETEYHPSADSAMEWYKEWKKDIKRYCIMKEAIASTALAGNRLSEILLSTMDRLEKGEPVSDRYLLGLCWFLRYMFSNEENWISVVGYENNYLVSNLGRVERASDTENALKGKILALVPDMNGYLKVHLYKNGKGKIFMIHRIVMQAFVGKIPKGKQVNHKNGVKEDNRLENLEYVTCSENHKHAYNIGLKNQKGNKNNASKLTKKDVSVIKKRLVKGNFYKDIAIDYNVSVGTIGFIARRETWKHV